MKLVSTNPVVGKTSINAVPVQRYDDGSAQALAQAGRIAAQIGNVQTQGNEMAGRAFGNLGRTVGQIGSMIQHQQEETDAVNAQAAANEYTRRVNDLMYNDENGLMNTKFEGASGITQDFTEQEKKIRQEVYGQYHFHTAKGQMAFNKLADRSAAQRFESVRQHQIKQYEAYRKVTYDNALTLNTQEAADNYASADMVDASMKQAILTTTAQYYGQGDEVIKAAQRKVVGDIAQQVINRAYSNGDDDMASTYIEKYGEYMSPALLTNYSKAVHQRTVANITRNTADALVSKYGDNTAALYDAIYNRREGGNGYDGNAAVAWMREQEKNGTNWGINTCTKGVNAALMAGGGIPGNTWAPTNWDDAKKSGTAFTDRSQLRTGDIVYWWKPGSDKDADDTSHVGIYDAETGKVYQSGTSGFRAIDLDSYSVTGFAHPQGRGMTRDQQDALFSACQRQLNQRRAMRNAYDNATYKDLDKQLMGLADAGNMDWGTYTSMVDQIAGADPEMRKKGYASAKYWWGMATGTSEDPTSPWKGSSRSSGKGGPKSLDFGVKQKLEQALTYHDFETKSDWATFVMQYHPSKDEYGTLMNMYDNKMAGKGSFAFDWSGMEKVFKASFPKLGEAEEGIAWRNAKAYATQKINDIRSKENREPTDDEVQKFLVDSMTEVSVGEIVTPRQFLPDILPDRKEEYKPTKGRLAREDVQSVEMKPTGQVEVTMGNGVKYLLKDTESFRDALDSGKLRNRRR